MVAVLIPFVAGVAYVPVVVLLLIACVAGLKASVK